MKQTDITSSRLFVICAQFIGYVREVVIVKWVPRGLNGGVCGDRRGKNSVSSFVFIMTSITELSVEGVTKAK